MGCQGPVDLQAQHRQLRELEIRLQSMASRIEVISTDLGVTVDGESIAAGEVSAGGGLRVAVGDGVEIAVSQEKAQAVQN